MLELITQYNSDPNNVISPSELKQTYLYGLNITSKDGSIMSEDTYNHYIEAAQTEIEELLNIKLKKQVINETLSIYRDDFEQFGFIRVTYPIVSPVSLHGYLGTIRQITYPPEWLSSRQTSDGKSYMRNLYIVPNVGAATTGSVVYNGVVPYIGISSFQQVPNFWNITYITGFDKIPAEILNIIGKLASINILSILGDLAIGKPGVTNYSLGIDGLSQSIGTPVSAQSGAFGGRIKQYTEDIKTTLDRIKGNYKGFTLAVC